LEFRRVLFRSAVGFPKVLRWGIANTAIDEKIDRAAEVEKFGRNDLRNALRPAGRAVAAPQGFREYTADALCPLEDQQVIERCTGSVDETTGELDGAAGGAVALEEVTSAIEIQGAADNGRVAEAAEDLFCAG